MLQATGCMFFYLVIVVLVAEEVEEFGNLFLLILLILIMCACVWVHGRACVCVFSHLYHLTSHPGTQQWDRIHISPALSHSPEYSGTCSNPTMTFQWIRSSTNAKELQPREGSIINILVSFHHFCAPSSPNATQWNQSPPLLVRSRGYVNSFRPLGDHLETAYYLVLHTHTRREKGRKHKNVTSGFSSEW